MSIPPEPPAKVTPRRLAAAAGLFGVVVLAVAVTLVADVSFVRGSVVIETTPRERLLTLTGMTPGDSVEGALTVSNVGTLPLRYAMTSTTSGRRTLDDRLFLTVTMSDVASGGCDDFDGERLYEGPLREAAFGHPGPGADDGDRTLLPGTDERLCFRAELPLWAGDAEQDDAASVTFDFHAEGVAGD